MELVVETTVFEVSDISALCAAAVTMVAATSASIFMFEFEFFKLVTIDVATAFVTSATAVVLTVSRGLKCDHKKNTYAGWVELNNSILRQIDTRNFLHFTAWPFKINVPDLLIDRSFNLNPFSAKMVKQFVDELFECVWPFCGVGA